MYIASQAASKWPDLANHVPELYKERVEFIRTAAIALLAQSNFASLIEHPSQEGVIIRSAVSRAQKLWDALPEDC